MTAQSESGMVSHIDSKTWLLDRLVGKAMPGKDVRVRDAEGNELPPGEPGLLRLLANRPFEYKGDPDKTERSHLDGYFIPGDIGYLDEDGFGTLCDRRTDIMIHSGGVNIYPAEIEAELLGHEAVLDAAVFGQSDPDWGERVVGLVELPARRARDHGLHPLHCRTRLANQKGAPGAPDRRRVAANPRRQDQPEPAGATSTRRMRGRRAVPSRP